MACTWSMPFACPQAAATKRSRSSTQRAFGDRVQEVVLVAEVDVEEGTRQAGALGDPVHGDGVPADLRVQLFGRVDHLGAAALFLFFPADGDVAHSGTLPGIDTVSITGLMCNARARQADD